MVSKFVDMQRDPEEVKEDYPVPSVQDAPKYPYGLCISLCEDELEKLGLDDAGLEPGDILHLHAFALVSSVSENATVDGDPHCRVELQITHLATESEDDENEEDGDDKPSYGKLYK